MLVLTRRRDESIVIDDNILITVNEISGSKVKLGITAPQNLRIIRVQAPGADTQTKEPANVGA